MRVVSLLPSATETLCAIGGESMLVGRSHECDYPTSLSHLPILTGQRTHATTSAEIDRQVKASLSDEASSEQSLYTLDTDLMKRLKPDVILTQDLCDVCSIDLNTVRSIARDLDPVPTIVSLNPMRMEDIYDDLLKVGQAVNLETQAQKAMVDLRARYWDANDFVNPYVANPEVAFLEWMDPLFIGGHWTPQLIEAAGGRHSLNQAGMKSKQVTPEDLVASMPDKLVICPCGYDLDAIRRELDTLTHAKWWPMIPAVQEHQVVLVDGNQMFNRPGPRLVDAFCWLVSWINDRDEVMPEGFPVESLT
ncbi:MAG: ABC transporter substrate-binding protein [Planctomycetota bacterium]|nr:ABC transporter substrate-binding protein [Planctomycetota bacterium]